MRDFVCRSINLFIMFLAEAVQYSMIGSCWGFTASNTHTQSFFQCVEKIWVYSWGFQLGILNCSGNSNVCLTIHVFVDLSSCSPWTYPSLSKYEIITYSIDIQVCQVLVKLLITWMKVSSQWRVSMKLYMWVLIAKIGLNLMEMVLGFGLYIYCILF